MTDRGCRLVSIAAALLLLWGPRPAAAEENRIDAVASIFPVADLVRRIGGPQVRIRVLLPPGATPHTFEPTPKTVADLSHARVFFIVGAGLEGWAEKVVAAAAPADMVTVDLSEGIDLIRRVHGAEAERRIFSAALGMDRPNGETGANPHYWLDPRAALAMADRIESALSVLLPAFSAPLAARAAAVRSSIAALDREIEARMSSLSSRRLVTFHDSWAYFARRYGLERTGVIEVSPGREPGARHVAGLIDTVRRLGIPAVFGETRFSTRAAAAVAREAGVKFLLLDPMGGVPPDRLSYEDLLRYNASVLEEGLR